MEENGRRDLESLFAQVEDPRMERTRAASIAGYHYSGDLWSPKREQTNGWRSKNSGKQKRPFLRICSTCPMGYHLTIRMARVFALIDPKQFEASFVQWVQGISQPVKGVIAIDGKTLRRFHDQVAEKKALHVVSAWAAENRLVLAQLATEEKSNAHHGDPRAFTAIGVGWLHCHH